MVTGSTFGLIAYYTIGWYTGALIATAVSMVITILSTKMVPQTFSWGHLNINKKI